MRYTTEINGGLIRPLVLKERKETQYCQNHFEFCLELQIAHFIFVLFPFIEL